MLDRKAWIILLLCGAALTANIVLRGKLDREQAAREAVEKEKAAQVEPGTVGEAPGTAPPPGVGVVPGVVPEGATAPAEMIEERIVELRTEKAVFRFSTYGGGLQTVDLLEQQQVGNKEENVQINRHGTQPIGALTLGPGLYVNGRYELVSQNVREIVFSGTVGEGLQVTKKWSLVEEEEAGSGYRLRFELTIQNTGEQAVALSTYGISLGTAAPLYQREWDNQTGVFYRASGDYEFESTKWFKGGKRPTLEQEPGSLEYAGVTNQFFTTIVSPTVPYEGSFWAKRKEVKLPEVAGGGTKEGVMAGISLPVETLAGNGGVKALTFDILTSPKKNRMLRRVNADFGDVMNYGWFGAISNFLNGILGWIHTHIFVPISDKWSWGFAIVLLTIVIRGLMWPLQNKSTRSMKRMSLLKEPMAALKEKYPDDPNKLNQETMKLYREYGINPMGGCLPLFVQIPIFFGFYRMLQYAVELRQQEFLWVTDLSQPDTLATLPIAGGLPLNILPIVMAGTMVIQMSLTPKTGDKMQQRIFMLMPLMFFFFCYNFASALALYWTTSNIFAIVQTLITKRMPEPELKKRKKKGPGLMDRMQVRAEDMQKEKRRRQSGGGGGGQKPKKPKGPRTGG